MKNLKNILLIAGMGLSLQAGALTVSPMLVYFHAGNNVQDIAVSNADADTEYAQVSIMYLTNPAAANAVGETFVPGTTNPQTFGLMVSPTKVALQPGTSRKVRVVNLIPNVKTDRIYTLTITNINSSQKVGDTKTQMSMSYAYQIQVFVLPVKPLPVVTAKRNGTQVTITNSGNSYISLRSGQLCDTSGEHCQSLSAKLQYNVLYAGDSWTYTLPTAGVVKYNGVYAENKSMPVQSN